MTFGQVGYSLLGAFMDIGWVTYGVSLIIGAPGSNADVADELIYFHQFGAQGVIVAGNIMAILVGATGARIGLGRTGPTSSILLGIVGLVSFAVFMTDVFTGWMWNIGLFERGAIYPIMIGHVLLGTGLLSTLSPCRTTPALTSRRAN